MTNEEAVKMYLEKAESDLLRNVVDYQVIDGDIHAEFKYGFTTFHISEILFNIDYAKKVWGEEMVCSRCSNKITQYESGYKICDNCNKDYTKLFIPRWLYIMHQLCGMSNEERLNYLVKLFKEMKGGE
jgi:hypothetical protein